MQTVSPSWHVTRSVSLESLASRMTHPSVAEQVSWAPGQQRGAGVRLCRDRQGQAERECFKRGSGLPRRALA
eukprot:12102239-Alexandrium_andersonii.AAC.1